MTRAPNQAGVGPNVPAAATPAGSAMPAKQARIVSQFSHA